MKFDLTTAIAAAENGVEPWEFILVVDGRECPTRPLKTFELGVLKNLSAKSETEQREFFVNLFDDPKPDLASWNDEKIGAAAVAIVSYFGERSKKKSLHLQKQVAAAMATKAG